VRNKKEKKKKKKKKKKTLSVKEPRRGEKVGPNKPTGRGPKMGGGQRGQKLATKCH